MSPTGNVDHAALQQRYGKTVNYCQRGDLFALTGVLGLDPASGELATGVEAQFHHAFTNLAAIAEEIGFGLREIARVTVFAPDAGHRPLINPPWLVLWPDAEDRPARKTTHVPLAEGVHVELEVVGVRGGPERVSIEMEGLRHGDPLPMGARIGRYVFSSVIIATSPGDGPNPTGVSAIEQAFANMAAFVDAAGASMDDVSNVWTYLGMWDLHPDYVDVWVDRFKDEHSRPSRKTFYYPRINIQLQCEAVIGGARANLEIPGIAHHDPMPMGAVTGGVFTSSGVDSRDPETKTEPRGVAAQSRNVMANLARLLDQAGLSKDQLLHVTGLVGNRNYIPEFEHAWREMFPDPDAAPAWQVMELGLTARDNLVQVIARGTTSI